ncbi:hypothetical protein [Shewanella surugensis]|uniref:Uncharacterized protein n=1 Tax=Shewanella surugensis TaxID=212020 RepID=A0ABT0L920_9GAMM|nr:hypothetical protein [Shewanella surugensis]MCL1124202.1 hypothetical protein [Shewanella surugensis]
MNMLIQGGEDCRRLQYLLLLTDIESDAIKSALIDHYARGYGVGSAAGANGIDTSNLRRSMRSLNKVARIVEQIKEIDWVNHSERLVKEVS